jgi:hypothetical protein
MGIPGGFWGSGKPVLAIIAIFAPEKTGRGWERDLHN